MYALFVFIHYANCTHRIPNVSPELIFGGGLIFVKIFELSYRVLILGRLIFGRTYIQDFTVFLIVMDFEINHDALFIIFVAASW